MKSLIAIRANNKLFNVFMIFSGLTFMLVWLPLLRCLFDGPSYSWGASYFGYFFSSKGIQVDYFILLPMLVFFIAMYLSFYWVRNRGIFYFLLGFWWLLTSGNFLYDIIKDGDKMFHGDTLNIHVSITYIIIPIAIITLIYIALIIIKDRGMEVSNIKWNNKNRNKALIILSPIVLQGILYMIGEPHGLTDEIAVIITIIQSFLIPIIFFPVKQKKLSQS